MSLQWARKPRKWLNLPRESREEAKSTGIAIPAASSPKNRLQLPPKIKIQNSILTHPMAAALQKGNQAATEAILCGGILPC